MSPVSEQGTGKYRLVSTVITLGLLGFLVLVFAQGAVTILTQGLDLGFHLGKLLCEESPK
jgi:hypothetical protein